MTRDCLVVVLGAVLATSIAVAESGRTLVRLEIFDENLPSGTRVTMESTVRLAIYGMPTVEQQRQSQGKSQPAAPMFEQQSADALRWTFEVSDGPRSRKSHDFLFPFDLLEAQKKAGGMVSAVLLPTTFTFWTREPDGSWKVARTGSAQFGLPVRTDSGELTPCIRLFNDAAGFGVGVAANCSKEAFEQLRKGSGACPTGNCGKDG